MLLSEHEGDLHAVYTRRREDLRSHPGQISFPGGRVDPGETVEQAAVREAVEEVGLDPSTVEIIGQLPAFFIPPSRFWLSAVVARWTEPHPLVPAEAEVAEVLDVPFSRLRDPQVWRTVRLSSSGWTWAWLLDGDHVLWGATALVTAVILGMLDPDWSGGVLPEQLPDREVRPWEVRLAPAPGPARLAGVSEVPTGMMGFRSGPVERPTQRDVEGAGALIAEAVRGVAAKGLVLVLAGEGGNGAAARAAARLLDAEGREVVVVSAGTFDGSLPAAGVVVDGLVGGGLQGALRSPALDIAHALRLQHVPTIAVDIPTGVHPEEGMVGEAITADVTVSLAEPWSGLFAPGLAPFIGDLYAPAPDRGLVRLVGTPTTRAWAE